MANAVVCKNWNAIKLHQNLEALEGFILYKICHEFDTCRKLASLITRLDFFEIEDREERW